MGKNARFCGVNRAKQTVLCGGVLFVKFLGKGLNLFAKIFCKNYLNRGRHSNLVKHIGAALIFLVKKGKRVDRIAPKFNANGLFKLGRKKVEYSAPYRKLTYALNHGRAGIARRNKPCRDFLKRHFAAVFYRKGMLFKRAFR